MNPEALKIKENTIARYQYLVNENYDRFVSMLATAKNQPDEYWEERLLAQNHGLAKASNGTT